MREFSLANAVKIGQTVTSELYMLDDETWIDLSISPLPLEQIEREKKNARAALKAGLPAIFSFELVKCGDRYGVIYEHLHDLTLGCQIMKDPAHFDHYADLYADLSKKIHSVHVNQKDFVSLKDTYIARTDAMGEKLSGEEKEKCIRLIEQVPERDTYISIGYQPSRLIYHEDSLLLNYFDYSGYGHPIYDLANSFVTLCFLVNSSSDKISDDFINLTINLDRATAKRLWNAYLCRYFPGKTDMELKTINQLLCEYSYLTLLFSDITMPGVNTKRVHFDAVSLCRRYFFPEIDKWIQQTKDMLYLFE